MKDRFVHSRYLFGRIGAKMRTFIIAFASFGLFATAAQAADDAKKKAEDTSPIVTKLEDDAENNQLVLIQLTKNKISLNMRGKDLCATLKYGQVVPGLEHQTKVIKDGQEETKADLDWLICRFKRK
jgi:hypothetical protein